MPKQRTPAKKTTANTRTKTKKAPAKKAPTKKPLEKAPARKKPVNKPARTKPRTKKPPTLERASSSARRLTHLDAVEKRARKAADANRAIALRLIADIRRRMARIGDDFHSIGRALRRLSDEALYRALGYDSFEALLKGEKLVTKTIAYKYIAVAEAYPAAQARNLGVGKAYQLLAYAAATPAADIARTLATENPRIGNRRLDRMSVRELREATRRVKAATGAKKADTQPERNARRLAREVQRALRAQGAKSAKARAHRLDGRWSIRLDLGVDDAGILLDQ